MPIDYQEWDARTIPDGPLEAYHSLVCALQAERAPEDSPPPMARTAWTLRQSNPDTEMRMIAAVEDGRWLGAAQANVHPEPLLRIDLGVAQDSRRRGIGSQLLQRAAGLAVRLDRSVLIGDTYESASSGEAFAQSVGAEKGLANHVNRLLLADVDPTLVERWIEEGPQRASGYELTGFDGRCPDELVEGVAGVLNAIFDAPRDDADAQPFTITPELFRSVETAGLAGGTQVWWLLARQKTTGQIVGETDVRWHPDQPERIEQGYTVVQRDHRGHALGKWLKATMLRRIMDERPGVEEILTANADSNDAMVGINRGLGFRPYLAWTSWRLPVDQFDLGEV
jgi:mycothiol synthase